MGDMSTPFWVAGKPVSGPNTTVVLGPFDSSVAGEHDVPDAEDVARAVPASAETAALPGPRIPSAASAAPRAGGVAIGDVPRCRADQMRHGGVKDSGVGREGPASATADLTEEQVTVFTGLAI
jgi:hypothetical protein